MLDPSSPQASKARLPRRQLSLFVPHAEYIAIRNEAIRRKTTIAQVLREMLEPDYSRLIASHNPQ